MSQSKEMNKESLIKLAFVAHPHGIKGEAEIRLINTNVEECILDDEMKVWLFPTNEKSKLNPSGEEWLIKKLRFGNKIIATFEGIKDRSHLETMIPFEIFLDRDSFPEPDENEFYLVDLIDMPVFSPEGEELGKIESFSDNGMQYLFDVRLVDGSKITLPYVDAFFPEVDVENNRITMVLPEYSE
jgi:16S rRNA processing protein RimM